MNTVTIDARITKKWTGSKDGKPINIQVIDDSSRNPVRYQVTFWKEKEYELISALNIGDEISFVGSIVGILPSYYCIVICPEKIISTASIRKDIKFFDN